MDSTPSPITPAYNYTEPSLLPYDSLLRQDVGLGFLPSPTGITPFIDSSMMIAPVAQEPYHVKPVQTLAPAAYPPLPVVPELSQMSTPTLPIETSMSSTSSVPSLLQAVKPGSASSTASAPNPSGKKNKYPCPYAQSHNCSATFTTSGHAARHGKKHTGEKGVHCPICDKAFTRKDNMKQHERTHKNRPANGEEKKSKAQATREASKVKDLDHEESIFVPAKLRKLSSGTSDPSDTTFVSNTIDTPIDISPSFMLDNHPQIAILPDGSVPMDPMSSSMYPPLVDDPLLGSSILQTEPKTQLAVPQPPALVRGFSDLDTLAQAAESAFEPYFQQTQHF